MFKVFKSAFVYRCFSFVFLFLFLIKEKEVATYDVAYRAPFRRFKRSPTGAAPPCSRPTEPTNRPAMMVAAGRCGTRGPCWTNDPISKDTARQRDRAIVQEAAQPGLAIGLGVGDPISWHVLPRGGATRKGAADASHRRRRFAPSRSCGICRFT